MLRTADIFLPTGRERAEQMSLRSKVLGLPIFTPRNGTHCVFCKKEYGTVNTCPRCGTLIRRVLEDLLLLFFTLLFSAGMVSLLLIGAAMLVISLMISPVWTIKEIAFELANWHI